MSFHCFLHGEAPDGAFSCPKCAAGWIGQTPPAGWRECPHCLGSGLVQADDQRVTTSPVFFPRYGAVVSSTWFPTTAVCNRCGKPEHGSLACEYAPGWPEPPKVEYVATSLDPSAPGGPLDRIADALTRIAAALEAHNTGQSQESSQP